MNVYRVTYTNYRGQTETEIVTAATTAKAKTLVPSDDTYVDFLATQGQDYPGNFDF